MVGLINHFSDLSQNLVAGVIQFLEDLLAKIMMSKSNLEMDLGLGGVVSAFLCVGRFSFS